MPWTKPGTYRIRTEWGWSAGPFKTSSFTYSYQLDFDLVVTAPVTKYETSLSLSANGKGSTFNVTGTPYIVINGYEAPMPGQNVTLTYTKPDGKEVRKTVTAGEDGSFLDKLTADAGGTWRVKATMEGNAAVEAASSETVQFNAEAASPLSQIPVAWEAVLVGVSLGVILLVVRKRLPGKTCSGSA